MAPLKGQLIRGLVVDEGTNGPLEGVVVMAVDSTGSRVGAMPTDALGRFSIDLPRSGSYQLRAGGLIGYADFTTDPFAIGPELEAWAEIRLSVLPVPIEPLDVEVEGRVQRLEELGFYQRLERGIGHFLQREAIESQKAERVTELLYGIPGVQVVPVASAMGQYDVIMRGAKTRRLFSVAAPTGEGAAPCFPTVVLDGLVVRRGGYGDDIESGRWNELVHPFEIEGLELYPSGNGLPAQYGGMTSPCGAILIWTRWDL